MKALFIFAFIPEGGSFVNLMDLSNIPMGTPVEGSADSKRRKLMCDPPVSPEKESKIFYNSSSHLGMR